MKPAEVGASTSINFQSRGANLISGDGANWIFVTAYNAAFNALSNPTQSTSPILNVYSWLYRILDQHSFNSFEFKLKKEGNMKAFAEAPRTGICVNL